MTHIAREYAQALYDLARDEGQSRDILDQMEIIQDVLEKEPDFLRLLSVPTLSRKEKTDVLDKVFSNKLNTYLLNFLKILSEKGYAKQIPDCIIAFRDLYDDDHGILRVRATTAVPLTSSQTARLQQAMEKRTGKTIILTNRIDAGSMGGVRLDWDNLRVDDTVSHRLEMIHKLLDKTEL